MASILISSSSPSPLGYRLLSTGYSLFRSPWACSRIAIRKHRSSMLPISVKLSFKVKCSSKLTEERQWSESETLASDGEEARVAIRDHRRSSVGAHPRIRTPTSLRRITTTSSSDSLSLRIREPVDKVVEVKLHGMASSRKLNRWQLLKSSGEAEKWPSSYPLPLVQMELGSAMVKSPETEHPVKAFGWAARQKSGHLSPFNFSRRATGERDVRIKVVYCGFCHFDFQCWRDEWGSSIFPMVPGHEITGRVVEVGSKVQKFKVGDKVGLGPMLASCLSCDFCTNDLEHYCSGGTQDTFNSVYYDGTTTYGGFSDTVVADEHYVLRWPDSLPLDAGAPLLCAGITTYSPLKNFGLDKPGVHVGVVGLGGLGHVAVRFAKAFGAKVTVISTSPGKKKDAIDRLGVDSFLVSHDPDQMQAAVGTLDGIIQTVSANIPVLPLIELLKSNGKLVFVGVPDKSIEIPVHSIMRGKIVCGSCIGGMKQTQEMLDFAAKHSIVADVEVIPIDYVNTAMERIARSDVKYRFVIDIENTLKAPY